MGCLLRSPVAGKEKGRLPPERRDGPFVPRLLWGPCVREAGASLVSNPTATPYQLLNVHMHLLFLVVDPRGIQGAGCVSDRNELTQDALRPRSDAGRADEAEWERRSSPQSHITGKRLGGTAVRWVMRPTFR